MTAASNVSLFSFKLEHNFHREWHKTYIFFYEIYNLDTIRGSGSGQEKIFLLLQCAID